MRAEEIREQARKCYGEFDANKRATDLLYAIVLALASVVELLEEEQDARTPE